jgi:hypothetical protein
MERVTSAGPKGELQSTADDLMIARSVNGLPRHACGAGGSGGGGESSLIIPLTAQQSGSTNIKVDNGPPTNHSENAKYREKWNLLVPGK